ncbi:MAG: hypothetical protein IJI14_07085 [Anaerolineaceae bacterium]|nr:hypothetical protein [Anaerolineaceae bacterium]
MSALTLKIVTPDGNDRMIECDSVTLWMAADSKGKQEGSIGIRRGHTEAVIALGNGPLEAHQEGQLTFSARSEGGFATVLNNTITVITNHLAEKLPD